MYGTSPAMWALPLLKEHNRLMLEWIQDGCKSDNLYYKSYIKWVHEKVNNEL